MGQQDSQAGRLTLAQAAKALGVSTRTLRRRVDEGKLSATKEQRGERELWTVDGAELARYAETTGQTLALAALTADEADRAGHGTANAASAATPDRGEAHVVNDSITALVAELDKTRHENAALEAQTAALTAERDWLRARVEQAEEERLRLLDALPKALPPARSWWSRLFRGKGGSANG